jgi:ketosteroid isomerase-like protein
MTFKRCSISAAVAAIAFAAVMSAPALAACPAQDPAAVSGTVQAMFSAMATGDVKTARSTFTPDFYLFDNGVRFDADGILALVQQAQHAGSTYTWKVTEPDVHFACKLAWIAYVNQGGVTKDGQQTPLTWLESGVLQYERGRWMIRFMHSTRVPPKKTP